MKRLVFIALLALAPAVGAQSVTPETLQKIADGIEAYYRAHPERRPSAMAAARKPEDPTSCKRPEWPKEALRNEQQGTVKLAFLIGLDGSVRASKVETSSGFPLLDAAAQEALSKCQFKPQMKDGKPEEAWVKVAYVWTLE